MREVRFCEEVHLVFCGGAEGVPATFYNQKYLSGNTLTLILSCLFVNIPSMC